MNKPFIKRDVRRLRIIVARALMVLMLKLA
jgi:hypothetical protein